MKKEVIIDLPDAGLLGSMVEDAWKHFLEAAKGAGWKMPEEVKAMAKDFFAAGYCCGYNDLLQAIKQQLEAEEAANDLIKGL